MKNTFRLAFLACGLASCTLAFASVPVRVATVERAPHAVERKLPGRVEAIHAVEIRARTEGTIVQRHFQDGRMLSKATCCSRWMTPSRARR